MAVTVYTKPTALTGGGTALDGISASALATGDEAFVEDSGVAYRYKYSATNSAVESIPDVIAPDDAGATGRWLLQLAYQPAASETQAGKVQLADTDEAEAGVNDTKVLTPAKGTALVQGKLDVLGPVQDRDAILFDAVNGLVSGSLKGVEGRWDVVAVESITVDATSYVNAETGTTRVALEALGETGHTAFGTATAIDEDVFGVVIGNSKAYIANRGNQGASGYYLFLNSKHDDVRSDFTVGNSYAVIVCKEDSTSSQDSNGDLTITEYLLGGDVDTVAEIEAVIGGSAPQVGTINAGYWDGPVWTPQLLDDVKVAGQPYGRVHFQRKNTNLVSLSLRKSDGTWQEYTENSDRTQYGKALPSGVNYANFNVTDSYAGLGYSSEADMLALSAVKIVYKAGARRVRPASNPTGVKVLGGLVWYLNHSTDVGGAPLVSELIGSVPVNSVVPAFGQAAVKAFGFYANNEVLPSAYAQVDETIALNSGGPNAVKFFTGLFQSGGNWHVALWFEEVVYDDGHNEWADTGSLTCDNTTASYTQGNIYKVVQSGSACNGLFVQAVEDYAATLDWPMLYPGSDGILRWGPGGSTLPQFTIWDGIGWGDSGKIEVVQYVKTDLDDNGNVVRVGCMAYDTGVKHV